MGCSRFPSAGRYAGAGPVRNFAALGRPYWRALAGAAIIALLSTLASLGLPLGLRRLLNTALQRQDDVHLSRLALILFALFLVRSVLGLIGSYMLRRTGETIVRDLRLRTYAHLHSLDLAFFAQHRIGELLSRLVADITTVRSAVADVAVSSTVQCVRMIGTLTIVLWLNWRLGLVVLLGAPMASLTSRLFASRFHRLARAVQDRLADSTSIAHDALSAVRIVQLFDRAPFEITRYARAISRTYDDSLRQARTSSFFSLCLEMLMAITIVGVFWLGGRELLVDRLTAGDLVAFLFYTQSVSQGVADLAQSFATLSAAAGAIDRLFTILDATPSVREPMRVRCLPSAGEAIDIEHVSFSYSPESATVLRDVTLHVAPGETIAIVGSNGAGKTTLLNLLPRFYDPTEGRVTIGGVNIQGVSLRCLRERIAVVSQEVHLFDASILDNIRYGRLTASDDEVIAAARAAHAHEFIERLSDGYDSSVGEKGLLLSAGQRQRLSIARALLKEADILLLDEATASIDAVSEALICNTLERWKVGHTMFVISHRPATIRLADRIAVMHEGRLVDCGTHSELLARSELYAALHAGERGKATHCCPN